MGSRFQLSLIAVAWPAHAPRLLMRGGPLSGVFVLSAVLFGLCLCHYRNRGSQRLKCDEACMYMVTIQWGDRQANAIKPCRKGLYDKSQSGMCAPYRPYTAKSYACRCKTQKLGRPRCFVSVYSRSGRINTPTAYHGIVSSHT